MNKQIAVHSHNILHSNVKEQITDMCKHMGESPVCSTKRKKPDLMDDIV